MKAFPKEDLAKGLKYLDLGADFPPMLRSLGISWDVTTDEFTFQVSMAEKPYTRRGVLSTINSLYDPLGFAAPVSIKGRALLRELTTEACEWDEKKLKDWCEWKDSIKDLEHVRIPMTYTAIPRSSSTHRELCIFCDASTQAIAAVAYIKVTDAEGKSELGFLFGKAKLAPQPEVTAIVNTRPLIPVSTDPSFPIILTPATLLTQKVGIPPIPPGDFKDSDLYKRQWKQVQHLANAFWHRWKNQYLSTLQGRRKWQSERPNLQEGDLVLLKDSQVHRNQWPMGMVVKTFPSHDGKVRKIEVKVASG
ncbi:hypothetical protein KUCAC02_012705 [Chaenocephalus aceratus]|uniref:Uncharacterized protein n=1 Tax=Chaenocephalus aceratus TaxID=36190 RepID=A0ACB9XDF3_CHAAC|nr:hypothetical protein KUCAC02_012705 [Chaenocephalus aceratus]